MHPKGRDFTTDQYILSPNEVIKLQKRVIDIVTAYNMIEDTRKEITDLRANIAMKHEHWYKEAQEMARRVGEEITIPRITGRQIYRGNVEITTTSNYYQVNVLHCQIC